MKKNTIIITVLVLIALGLGAAIYYKQDRPQTANNNGGQQTNTQPQPSDPEFDKDLTEQQKSLFYNPGADATPEEMQAYFDLASSVAKEGDLISINGCTATPDVLKSKVGNSIKVKNTGTTTIEFAIAEDKRATVEAGKTVEVKDLFVQGPGLYGYGCQEPGVRRSIGMVLITP